MMQFYSTITSFYPTLLTAIKQLDICASLCIVCVVMIYDYTFLYYFEFIPSII